MRAIELLGTEVAPVVRQEIARRQADSTLQHPKITIMNATTPPVTDVGLQIKAKDGKIFSHVRQKWLAETPEERVRQEFLLTLVNEYGFSLSQIAEELEVTGRGSGHARSDYVIWRSAQDKTDGKKPAGCGRV
jgi:hypothetical protein